MSSTWPCGSRSYQMEKRHTELKERVGQLRAREQHMQDGLGPWETTCPQETNGHGCQRK